ncbi:MAG: DUF4230 domain-containing protein [Saprospiraceae bacterium]|nr:DUF4230 domain-containing protein [Saprospiraceae bacterium]
MKTIKTILLILLAIGLVVGGAMLGRTSIFPNVKHHTEEEGEVLLESIRETIKLVTLEATFSELYDYEDYYGYDFSPFRKKAMVRVKADVSIGFDLEKIELDALPEVGQLVVRNLPPAEILAIDHDLDYYDLQEGVFNSFSEKDLTELNKKAKEFIRSKALEGNLLEKGSARMNDLVSTLNHLATAAGWELVIDQYDSSVNLN